MYLMCRCILGESWVCEIIKIFVLFVPSAPKGDLVMVVGPLQQLIYGKTLLYSYVEVRETVTASRR